MTENVKDLTPKKIAAIHSLLTSHSITQAAKDAGVTVQTIYRWLDETPFREALIQAEGEAIDAAARGLVGLTEKAIQAVADVLESTTVHPATRLRAAEVVLANMLRLVELRNLDRRIRELEKRNG